MGEIRLRRYRGFGLTWESEIVWPGAAEEPRAAEADVLIELTSDDELSGRWSGSDEGLEWYLRVDQAPLVVKRGRGGDFLLSHGDNRFHLDASATVVSCFTARVDPSWLRLLLDTVLWTTAVVRGADALHAAAVETEDGVLALLGGAGSGKTTLALELLRRGARPFCDDVLVLEHRDDEIWAHPSPPFVNVPAAVAEAAEGLPITPIATLDDEVWSAVSGGTRAARPLARLVLLERGTADAVSVERSRSPVFDVRRAVVTHGLAGSDELEHFRVCSELVTRVPVSRLRADLEAPPAALADRLLDPASSSR